MPADENAAFRLSVLYDLSLYISGCKDPVEILAGIVRHLRAVMPIEYAWLIIRRGDAFAELAVLGEDGETVLPGTRPVDNTIIESIVMQEFDGVVPDLPRWKQHNEDGFFPEGAGSAVICPVQRGKDADGCLIVASRRKEAYGRDQALLLFMLALQLGIVLRSLQLRQALEEQNARRHQGKAYRQAPGKGRPVPDGVGEGRVHDRVAAAPKRPAPPTPRAPAPGGPDQPQRCDSRES
ncbi:MAG TPA: hypothetical protein PLM00_01250 [Spirochaetota bacterium]|nr:hypothetical protein [Spirochaetota bacterium]